MLVGWFPLIMLRLMCQQGRKQASKQANKQTQLREVFRRRNTIQYTRMAGLLLVPRWVVWPITCVKKQTLNQASNECITQSTPPGDFATVRRPPTVPGTLPKSTIPHAPQWNAPICETVPQYPQFPHVQARPALEGVRPDSS